MKYQLAFISLLSLALLACDRPNGNVPTPKNQSGSRVNNTEMNVRDRDNTITPFDQSGSEADRTTTKEVRKAVMSDDSLSVTAKNVKIVTINGVVTLRGPVKNNAEKEAIVQKASSVAGVKSVNDQLDVEQVQ